MRLALVSTDSAKKDTGKFHGEFALTTGATGQLALPWSWEQRAWFVACIPLKKKKKLPLFLPETRYP